ncbi:hypothetical protein, partial [Streptomyces olivaceus]|uniref:hypothetical protein n=1 Tax=Streptomyces olivaceus TaxID=47716 RepID=UPI0036E9BA3C
MHTGIALFFEHHQHRALGVRYEGQRPARRTGQPRLQLSAVDPRPKIFQHRLGRHRDGTVVIDHPRVDHEHDDLTAGSKKLFSKARAVSAAFGVTRLAVRSERIYLAGVT